MKNINMLVTWKNIINKSSKRWFLSGNSAAFYWGMSNLMSNKWEFIVKKGTHPYIKDEAIKFKQKVETKIKNNFEEINYNNCKFYIMKKEYIIIELIKRCAGQYNDIEKEIIKKFFKLKKYNRKILFKIAEQEKIEKIVQNIEAFI